MCMLHGLCATYYVHATRMYVYVAYTFYMEQLATRKSIKSSSHIIVCELIVACDVQ